MALNVHSHKKTNLIAGNSVKSTEAPMIKDHIISCRYRKRINNFSKLKIYALLIMSLTLRKPNIS